MATYHAEEVGFVDHHRSKVWFVLVLLEVIHLMNIQDVLGAEFFLISWTGKIPGGRQARLRKGPSFAFKMKFLVWDLGCSEEFILSL